MLIDALVNDVAYMGFKDVRTCYFIFLSASPYLNLINFLAINERYSVTKILYFLSV